jgi:hypothetical protein
MKYKPQPVTDVDIAFGVRAIDLLPTYSEIPDEFKRNDNPWNNFWQLLFFSGGSVSEIEAVEGIDREAALRHIRAILGSFTPQHEHKIAGIAYLSSLWFESPPAL